jgi:uncharacterized SAM-binding protein YcdF (DUF218 family)
MDIIVKYLILPSSLIMLCAVTGLVLIWFRATRKQGVSLCIIALSGYVFFGAGPVAFLLLGHLEYQIPAATASERTGIRRVVILAAYAESDQGIPLSARVNGASAFRVLEALSLLQSVPDSMVIVSGEGAAPAIMREVLVAAGVPPERILVDSESSNTFESAKHLSPLLGSAPFLLVTSAGHMPRALGVFVKAGMNPRPVPTHFMARRNWLATQYLPSPAHLEYSDLAISEYVAVFWYRLKGWV